jgi:predicted outer membrane repeat protein
MKLVAVLLRILALASGCASTCRVYNAETLYACSRAECPDGLCCIEMATTDTIALETPATFFHGQWSVQGAGVYAFLTSKTRLFHIMPGTTVHLDSVGVVNTHVPHDDIGAGAIIVSHNASLTVTNSWFVNNTAERQGGAICSSGTLNVHNSTFRHNSAGLGGGIFSGVLGQNDENSSFLTVTNCTFEFNKMLVPYDSYGAGLLAYNTVMTMRDTVFRGNYGIDVAAFSVENQPCHHGIEDARLGPNIVLECNTYDKLNDGHAVELLTVLLLEPLQVKQAASCPEQTFYGNYEILSASPTAVPTLTPTFFPYPRSDPIDYRVLGIIAGSLFVIVAAACTVCTRGNPCRSEPSSVEDSYQAIV